MWAPEAIAAMIGTVASITASLLFTGVIYGVMKERVSQLQKKVDEAIEEGRVDRKDLRDEQKTFVTHEHLKAVVEPIRSTLHTVQEDVKEILKVVSSK